MFKNEGEIKKGRPEIILFTGFLGSGKTTMLIKTIEMLAEKKRKCAIIINEIGDVGIDNRQMRKLGYDVLDLFGGCVCCTLKVTLEATINHLLEDCEDLDYILFEPSGMADPSAMYPAITNCGYDVNEIHNIFIFDPLRVDLYVNSLNKLFNDSLNLAGMVVINKIDHAAPGMVKDAMKMVKDTRPGIKSFQMNVNDGLTPEFNQALIRERRQ
ncbi:GTP-binding protein [Acetobacterium bakii]|uniref:Cobalamin biosynthesis protein CobW n=1 Tax=Acetobacterium bakii TaxID=52689 RepID=A0A0L6U0Q9_9FIRM|nr:GTP-binding protein [Acetobacterium bakii]KNZ42093.1 cobalamin biosynthesis protein CobW [Acetobacterium bakii]